MPDHVTRNALATKIGGTIAEWKAIIAERLPITSLTMTDNTEMVQRNSVLEVKGQGFVNSEKGEGPALEHVMEMQDGLHAGEEFPVKRRVLHLGRGELL